MRSPRAFDALTHAAVDAEIIKAEVKHGTNNTPRSKEMTDPERLVVLVEEVGEVARAITYDEGDKDALVGELLQVAAMAMAWVEGLES